MYKHQVPRLPFKSPRTILKRDLETRGLILFTMLGIKDEKTLMDHQGCENVLVPDTKVANFNGLPAVINDSGTDIKIISFETLRKFQNMSRMPVRQSNWKQQRIKTSQMRK